MNTRTIIDLSIQDDTNVYYYNSKEGMFDVEDSQADIVIIIDAGLDAREIDEVLGAALKEVPPQTDRRVDLTDKLPMALVMSLVEYGLPANATLDSTYKYTDDQYHMLKIFPRAMAIVRAKDLLAQQS